MHEDLNLPISTPIRVGPINVLPIRISKTERAVPYLEAIKGTGDEVLVCAVDGDKPEARFREERFPGERLQQSDLRSEGECGGEAEGFVAWVEGLAGRLLLVAC